VREWVSDYRAAAFNRQPTTCAPERLDRMTRAFSGRTLAEDRSLAPLRPLSATAARAVGEFIRAGDVGGAGTRSVAAMRPFAYVAATRTRSAQPRSTRHEGPLRHAFARRSQ
jgi:hypothetical protein